LEGRLDSSSQALLAELTSSIPGIDEAMSFGELMRQVQSMDYEVIVFDTAPTGHTLRLLSFPTVLEKAFAKFMQIKDKFGSIFKQVTGLMGSTAPAGSEEKLLAKLEATKTTVESVNKQFRDATKTTFVCVCIPEFLSLFETERLVQELAKFHIDTHNIVVNQVLFPDHDSKCRKCIARMKMQRKYLEQILDLYSDGFHVVLMPLLDEEVRGNEAIEAFSKQLLAGHTLPTIPEGASSSASQSSSSSSTSTPTTSPSTSSELDKPKTKTKKPKTKTTVPKRKKEKSKS